MNGFHMKLTYTVFLQGLEEEVSRKGRSYRLDSTARLGAGS
jgi:hypothetical protein